MINISNVTKRFGRTRAVDNVSLSIGRGEAVALWGVNGAGKTTIIRCILGLLRCRGTITVDGFDVRRRGKQARKLIGYVPQELGFYDDLRVAEAIAFFARLKGVRVSHSDDVLARVGLSGHDRKRIRELSGGMKQRLALAIAMLGDPPILVLDEVTASLDACGREEFVSLLARLTGGSEDGAAGGEPGSATNGQIQRAGKTLLFASHRIEEVTTLARRVVMLDRGRIVAEVPSNQFASHLASTGSGTMLHLHIKPSARTSAIQLLRTHGFEPRLNGVGLLVPVPFTQKAAPFRILADGHISIDDFEVVAGPQVASADGHTSASAHGQASDSTATIHGEVKP